MAGLQCDFNIKLLSICLSLESIRVMTSMILYYTYDSSIVHTYCFLLFQDYLAQNSEIEFQMVNYLMRSLLFIHKHGDIYSSTRLAKYCRTL